MRLADLPWKWLYFRRFLTKLLVRRNRLNHDRIILDITFDCNLRCNNCNRSCSQAPSRDGMTPGQIEHFLRESREAGRRWTHIMIEGGEPTRHKDFLEILSLILDYRQRHSRGTEIILSTNGYGTETRRALSRVPESVTIYNSRKTSPEQTQFDAFNVAPIDQDGCRQVEFSRACHIPTFWGIGINRHGYYPCSVSSGIDRVFGFDIGRKALPPHGDQMQEELRTVCRFCGHFIPFNKILNGEHMSPSWIDAYQAYRETPPTLTLYGGPPSEEEPDTSGTSKGSDE